MDFRRSRVKTPTLLQMEAVECGAVALGIILSFYGRIVPLTELRRACGVSRDGSKASNMVKAARLYGLEAKGFKKELDDLRSMSVPFIVFWQFNHFLVVEGWTQKKVFLNDPATGPRTVSWQEFDDGFTGVTLVMEPGDTFVSGGRKPSVWMALSRQLKRSVSAWLYVVLIGFLLVIPGLIIPVFSQVFVDQVLIGTQEDWLRPLLLGLVMTTVLQGVLRGLQLGRLRDLKMKLMVAMNGQFLWHILRLPVRFYAQRFAGEISSRTALNTRVSDVIAGDLSATVIDGVMLVFYGVVMFTYDGFLTLIGIGAAMINLLLLQWVSRRRVDANLRLNQDLGKLSGVEISGLQSIETLKATASESDFFARWSGYYAETMNAQQELGLASQRIGLLPPFLSSMTTMLILVLGGLRVIDGHLSIGMLVAFQSLMSSFLRPVQTLVGFGQQLQTLESDLYRLDDVLNNPVDEGFERESDDSEAVLLQLQGRLEFRNVTFGYSQVAEPLLENFSFVLEPGKRIALVGSSGSGKSTIARLAAGLYQPWAGEILLDGRLRLDYHPLTLVQSMAMVEQDIFLFGGTVSENLSLWDSSVPMEDLIQACRDAEIHEVIAALPGGYSGMLLEGGADLSGGQRQRLEIARALVNQPSLLILDEATSALDAETEALIDSNLRQRGCACLIVAHRLSTIRDCDEIIVLHQGKVMEQGSHEVLWAKQGYYAALLKTEGETVDLAERSPDVMVPLSASSMEDVWRGAERQRWMFRHSVALGMENRVWRVCEGAVAIFAVLLGVRSNGGGRRYLCTVNHGDCFFSLRGVESTGWGLEAIASEPSTLEFLPLTPARMSLSRQWFMVLSRVVPGVASDYTLDRVYDFYLDLSQGLEQLMVDDRQHCAQRLAQKVRFNAEITHEAFRSLASVLQPKLLPNSAHGSELMQAMGAIAPRLNVSIQPIRVADLGRTDPVMAIAQASHFRVRRVTLAPGWWRSDVGALLGYLVDQTPVALLPRRGGYDLYNPCTQKHCRLTSRLAQSIESNAYTFYRPLPLGKRKAVLFRFALADQWGTLVLTFVIGIVVTLLGMLIPQATGMLIDYAIPNADQRTILHMGLGLALVATASTLFRLLQNLATMRLEAKGDAATQAALWDHLLKLKLDFFRQFSTGDLQSRVSAIRQIRQLLSGTTLRTLISGLVAFLNLVLLFVYSPPLAWVALVVTLLVVIATVVASLLIRGNILRQQQLSGELFGFIVQLINGITKLRVAHAENRAFASWANRFTLLVRLSFFQQRVEDAIALFNTVIPSLANAVIFWLVVDLLQPGSSGGTPTLTAGTYLAFNAAFGLLLSGATSLSNTLVNMLDVWILWGRVKPILEAESEIMSHMSDPGPLMGAIQLQNCTFRYRSDGPPVLSQINLSIRSGEFVALVGPSGGGKSTLLRLLLGFEVPESGCILYDGQDLRGLDVTAVRRQLGVVLQQSKINAMSLYENIAGNANITLEEAFQAASLAGMAEDIAMMPMGMHTLVSEGGGNLSGGQRQRLIIARALAHRPRLLLFDEATSSLDNRTQDIVARSLERLEITRVIVAHRLSTVRTADRILVLDRGKIMQSGTFDQLSQEPGLFQMLMRRQSI